MSKVKGNSDNVTEYDVFFYGVPNQLKCRLSSCVISFFHSSPHSAPSVRSKTNTNMKFLSHN